MRIIWKIVVPAVVAIAAFVAAPTMAWAGDGSLKLSINPGTPEQGVPAEFVFSGEVPAVDSEGDGADLEVEYRPTGGLGCQASMQDDEEAAGGASTQLAASTEGFNGPIWNGGFDNPPPHEGPGPFSTPYEYAMPATGSYLLCAYLEHYSQGAPDNTVVDATTSLTFSVSPPKVEVFTVGITPAQPGQLFTVSYTTQTDQQLRLEGIIVPAGGLPCAASAGLFEEELRTANNGDYNAVDTSLFSEDERATVFGGPTVTHAAATEKAAGSYVLCSWIEGPLGSEVDAALSTPFNVGAVSPPPPPPPPPAPPVVSDACLHDRQGVAHYELIVRRYEGRLASRHLSRRKRRADNGVLARARKNLNKDEGRRRTQCPNGR